MFDDARLMALALLAGLAEGADHSGAATALVAGLTRV
jgi:hypothetical protein